MGLAIDITAEDIVIPEFCPLLGIRLGRNNSKVGLDSPTLDRIRPELGYVKGNVWVISHRANTLKSDATAEELETIAAFLRTLGGKHERSKDTRPNTEKPQR